MTGNALKRAREETEAFKKRYPHIVAWWKEIYPIDHPTAEEVRAGLVAREKKRGQHDAK